MTINKVRKTGYPKFLPKNLTWCVYLLTGIFHLFVLTYTARQTGSTGLEMLRKPWRFVAGFQLGMSVTIFYLDIWKCKAVLEFSSEFSWSCHLPVHSSGLLKMRNGRLETFFLKILLFVFSFLKDTLPVASWGYLHREIDVMPLHI